MKKGFAIAGGLIAVAVIAGLIFYSSHRGETKPGATHRLHCFLQLRRRASRNRTRTRGEITSGVLCRITAYDPDRIRSKPVQLPPDGNATFATSLFVYSQQ